MARIVQYYTEYSKAMPLVCEACGWSGRAEEACMEMYDNLFDLECPTCLKMLLIVPYPTGEQTRAAAAAGNEEAIANCGSFGQVLASDGHQIIVARHIQDTEMMRMAKNVKPDIAGEAGHHRVDNLMYQLTPEALLESLNRAADLPAEERSRRRGEYEAYCNEKLGLAGVAPEMKALAPRLSSQGKVNR